MYIPQIFTYTPLIAIFAIAVTGHSFSLPGQQRSGQMTRAEHGHSSYPGHAESSPQIVVYLRLLAMVALESLVVLIHNV